MNVAEQTSARPSNGSHSSGSLSNERLSEREYLSERERPVREIVADLWRHTEALVDQELRLVRSELDEKLDQAKRSLVAAAISGALAFAGLLAVLSAMVLLLSERVVPWASALLVGGVLLVAAFALFERGKKSIQHLEVTPEKTKTSLQRTARTVQEAIK